MAVSDPQSSTTNASFTELSKVFDVIHKDLTDEQLVLFLSHVEAVAATRGIKSESSATCSCSCAHHHGEEEDEHEDALESIIKYIKSVVPPSAMAPGEKTSIPRGPGSAFVGWTEANTLHVDAFLFSDDDVDELCDKGLLYRFYCQGCGSRSQVKPLNFMSHSASRSQLSFIFSNAVMPEDKWKGKVLVDIGSRLGAALYYAYLYSDAQTIIGVEKNKFFHKLQLDVVTKFPYLADRIKLILGDVNTQKQLLQTADVVILNNSFEFFLTRPQQIAIWSFLKKAITKPGCTIISIPGLQDSFRVLRSEDLKLEGWVSEVPLQYTDPDDEEINTIHVYKVQ